MTSIACVVGEASGDVLAAQSLSLLKQKNPHLVLSGVGGPALHTLGFNELYNIKDLSVNGLFEVLGHLPRLFKMRRNLRDFFIAQQPRLFLGVDAPDFNFGLALQLRQKGIKTAHLISPSLWAWRGGRIKHIQQAIDLMLVIFPFEVELYQKAGIAVEYVGHPLASLIAENVDTAAARHTLGLALDAPMFAMLPGSRNREISSLADTMIAAALAFYKTQPQCQFISAFVHEAQRDFFQQRLSHHCAQHGVALPWHCFVGQSHAVMAACDAMVVASGTASLEGMLHKKPMVIVYRMMAASAWLFQRLRYQPWVGLPNILTQEFLVPELLQGALNPQALCEHMHRVCNANLDYYRARCLAVHVSLKRDTPALVSKALSPLL